MSQNPPNTDAAVYAALTSPAITVGGVSVAVYGALAPKDAALPHITREEFVSPWSTKSNYGTEHLLRFHVWDVGTSSSRATQIANTVITRLVDVGLTVTGHTCLPGDLDQKHIFAEDDGTLGTAYTHAVVDIRIRFIQN
jgi:hypothetical protein